MLFALLSNLFRLIFLPLLVVRRVFAAPRGAFVLLELDGPVADYVAPPRSRIARFVRRRGPEPLSVTRVLSLCELIAEDPRVAGLVVRVRSVAAGPSVIASLRKAFARLRDKGKPVVFDLPMGADNAAMLLASAGSRIVVGPETLVAPLGYAVESRYLKGALGLIGVKPEVVARGRYKAAAEQLVREDMSEPQREQLGEVLAARHDALVSALAERSARRRQTKEGGPLAVSPSDRDEAAKWIDEGPHRAVRAVEVGLADAVAYEDGLDQELGLRPSERARFVSASAYLASRRAQVFRAIVPRPSVGVVEVHGPIVSRARFAMGPLATEEHIISALRLARMSRQVRSVVLHIDSPGGSALASDRIHHEVERLSAEKPVIAYLSNVAASGGYYVAAGARRIVAEAETVTGSIGVVSAHFVLRGLFDKLGVTTDVVKRGARADLFSPSRPLAEGERAVLEAEIEAFYKTFVGVVSRGRGKPVEEIEALAQGRIWSGAEAQVRGLVDELGSFEDAVRRAAELSGVRSLEPVLVRPPRFPLPPPPAIRAAQALLSAVGLESLAERFLLWLNLDRREHVLLYDASLGPLDGSDGRTSPEVRERPPFDPGL